LTDPAADRILPKSRPTKAEFVSATDLQPIQDRDPPEQAAARSRAPRRLGLSGKLLLLTIPLV